MMAMGRKKKPPAPKSVVSTFMLVAPLRAARGPPSLASGPVIAAGATPRDGAAGAIWRAATTEVRLQLTRLAPVPQLLHAPIELGLLHHPDLEQHLGVELPAQLRALAAELARAL